MYRGLRNAFILTAAVTLSSLSGSYAADIGKKSPDPIKVSVFHIENESEIFKQFEQSLRAISKKETPFISYMSYNANSNYEEMYDIIGHDFKYGNAAIAISSEVKSSGLLLDLSKEAKTPVIYAMLRPPVSLRTYEKAWFVGTNPNGEGKAQAELIMDFIKFVGTLDKNGNGAIDTILLKGISGGYDTNGRSSGVSSALISYGYELNFLSKNHDDNDFSKAKKDVLNQIKKTGCQNIELIIANSDVMALGAIEALQENGYNREGTIHNIPVFGIDGIDAAKQAIDAGFMTGTIEFSKEEMARTCLYLLKNRGTPDPKELKKLKAEVSGNYIFLPSRKYTILEHNAE